MNFNRLAPFYDRLASLVFFGTIRRCQIDCLSSVPLKGNVLILGGGTGWIIPYIFESGQVEDLTYVELSGEMIEYAENSCPPELSSLVEFIHGDEHNIPDRPYDTVLTFFVLDCFDEERLKNVMQIIRDRVKAEGWWYFADFRIDRTWYRKIWQGPVVWLMIKFFRTAAQLEANRLVNFDEYFKKNGLKPEMRRFYLSRLIERACYHLKHEI